MNKDYIIDYSGCAAFKFIGPILRLLPLSFIFFLGRRLGELVYYLDYRHKAVVYSNLKIAFGKKLAPVKLNRLAKDFYRAFGQNFMEIFLIPRMDKEYLSKYVSVSGAENIHQGLGKGRGIILLVVHAGSWELSNIISANIGFAFNMFVRVQQRYPRLNQLLNSYRQSKGCKLIERQGGLRYVIEAFKNNEAVGMSADQGGVDGTIVEFFGGPASMSSGAVRLALKYNLPVLPVFSRRINGPYIRLIIERAFELKKSGDLERDVCENLQGIMRIFEKYISQYPEEYLWTYKVWKYTNQKNILILSDSRAGHLRQAQAASGLIKKHLAGKGINADIHTQEVLFKTGAASGLLKLCSLFSGRYCCQGCLLCLKKFLTRDSYEALIKLKPDIIISCGSSLAAVNLLLSRENLSKSIVIMRPPFLNFNCFDLVIMPQHDRPPKRKNIVVTEGALNLVDEKYLQQEKEKLLQAWGLRLAAGTLYIGILIGGDAKGFCLAASPVREIIKQLKLAAEKLNANILVTTSRRTHPAIEAIVRQEFSHYPRCKLIVIANENNPAYAVGGILGVCDIIITSPESVSMISEAVNSKKYVLVFEGDKLDKKHRRYLDIFAENQYIYLTRARRLAFNIERLWSQKPQIRNLRDNFLVEEALKKIL